MKNGPISFFLHCHAYVAAVCSQSALTSCQVQQNDKPIQNVEIAVRTDAKPIHLLAQDSQLPCSLFSIDRI